MIRNFFFCVVGLLIKFPVAAFLLVNLLVELFNLLIWLSSCIFWLRPWSVILMFLVVVSSVLRKLWIWPLTWEDVSKSEEFPGHLSCPCPWTWAGWFPVWKSRVRSPWSRSTVSWGCRPVGAPCGGYSYSLPPSSYNYLNISTF